MRLIGNRRAIASAGGYAIEIAVIVDEADHQIGAADGEKPKKENDSQNRQDAVNRLPRWRRRFLQFLGRCLVKHWRRSPRVRKLGYLSCAAEQCTRDLLGGAIAIPPTRCDAVQLVVSGVEAVEKPNTAHDQEGDKNQRNNFGPIVLVFLGRFDVGGHPIGFGRNQAKVKRGRAIVTRWFGSSIITIWRSP